MSRRRLAIVLSILAFVLVFVLLAVKNGGTWLVVEDPLQHARSIVVLVASSRFPRWRLRAPATRLGARSLAKPGRALRGRPRARALGIDAPRECVYSREVLEHLGVPAPAIHVAPEETINTADEIRAIVKYLPEPGADPVIVIASKYHSRRVRMLWHLLVGTTPAAVVRYPTDDPSDPTDWWRDTRDATAVAHEWVGLLNAWAGFPIKSSFPVLPLRGSTLNSTSGICPGLFEGEFGSFPKLALVRPVCRTCGRAQSWQ